MSVPSFAAIISIDRQSAKAVYLQIIDGLTGFIRSGKLLPGERLPNSRDMAKSLTVHRKTLQTALDELTAQGWLEVIPRKGTYVAVNFPEPRLLKFLSQNVKYPERTNFTIRKSAFDYPKSDYQLNDRLILTEGYPDIRLAPIHELLRELRSIAARGSMKKYFRYGNPQGTAILRETLAAHIAETRGIMPNADHILVTRGAQMATFLAARTILNRGDNVIVGDPGYVTATLTFQQAGGVINKVPVDDNGIDVDEVEKLCSRKKIRLVYVISHHHQPTTVSLSLERRARLMKLAEQYRFAVVEDDYDYDFHYSGLPKAPIASSDQLGNVIYIGTLSKTLIPSLRIGFMIAPENFISEAVKMRRLLDFQGDSFLEVAIAELYRSGRIPALIKRLTKTYKERRDHFCKLLTEELKDDVSFNVPDGGLAVWTRFRNAHLPHVSAFAAKKGLLFNDGVIYNTQSSRNATRLGFSSLNFEEQMKAVDVLKDATSYSRK